MVPIDPGQVGNFCSFWKAVETKKTVWVGFGAVFPCAFFLCFLVCLVLICSGCWYFFGVPFCLHSFSSHCVVVCSVWRWFVVTNWWFDDIFPNMFAEVCSSVPSRTTMSTPETSRNTTALWGCLRSGFWLEDEGRQSGRFLSYETRNCSSFGENTSFERPLGTSRIK